MSEEVRAEKAFSLSFFKTTKGIIFVALVTLVLAAPILGFVLINRPSGIELQYHWASLVDAVALVAIVFALRAFIMWVLSRSRPLVASQKSASPPVGLSLESGALSDGKVKAEKSFDWSVVTQYFGVLLLAFSLLLPFFPFVDRYWIYTASGIVTYIMLGWGLNIVVALAGLLDLGYVAFFAVGAYTYALLSGVYLPLWLPEWLLPWSFWICLPIAGILASAWGMILGFPVLRLRGDYLAIVTLAFGEIIRVVLQNWTDFTNGPNGVTGYPRPTFFGIPFNSSDQGVAALLGIEYSPIQYHTFMYYLILTLTLLTYVFTQRLKKLPLGRSWEALREDEVACRALGLNTTLTKLSAFAIGAMFAGFAGSFFAARQEIVTPESFNFMESIFILAIVVLGGLGSQIGVVIAAVVMVGGFELFRNLDFLTVFFGPDFNATTYRMIVFGVSMVVIMNWKPRGFITKRDPSIFLKEKKAVSNELVGEGHG